MNPPRTSLSLLGILVCLHIVSSTANCPEQCHDLYNEWCACTEGECTDTEIQNLEDSYEGTCDGCSYKKTDCATYKPCQDNNCTHTSGCQPGTYSILQTSCVLTLYIDTQRQETKITERCLLSLP